MEMSRPAAAADSPFYTPDHEAFRAQVRRFVDREVAPTALEQVVTAVQISVRATLATPIPIAAWGLVVATSLCLGAATLLVGLAVLMPVLGHGTWHLYRKLIAA